MNEFEQLSIVKSVGKTGLEVKALSPNYLQEAFYRGNLMNLLGCSFPEVVTEFQATCYLYFEKDFPDTLIFVMKGEKIGHHEFEIPATPRETERLKKLARI